MAEMTEYTVPQGWTLVPWMPTPEMIAAGGDGAEKTWKAMLTQAPLYRGDGYSKGTEP